MAQVQHPFYSLVISAGKAHPHPWTLLLPWSIDLHINLANYLSHTRYTQLQEYGMYYQPSLQYRNYPSGRGRLLTNLETWSFIVSTLLLGLFLEKSSETRNLLVKVVLKFSDFWCLVTLELLNGKTSFQSYTIEQYKSYWIMGIHPGEPKHTIFYEHLQVACTKRLLRSSWMSPGYGAWMNEVQDLLYLLVFVWSLRSERWPR